MLSYQLRTSTRGAAELDGIRGLVSNNYKSLNNSRRRHDFAENCNKLVLHFLNKNHALANEILLSKRTVKPLTLQ